AHAALGRRRAPRCDDAWSWHPGSDSRDQEDLEPDPHSDPDDALRADVWTTRAASGRGWLPHEDAILRGAGHRDSTRRFRPQVRDPIAGGGIGVRTRRARRSPAARAALESRIPGILATRIRAQHRR